MINDVDELLALRAGDKYRLNDIRRRLEIYKKLYISDLEFLRNLTKAYLGKDLSPEPRRPKPGQPQTGSDSCSSCGSQIGADEQFCTNCGAKKAAKKTRKSAKKTRKPRKEKETKSSSCVKCGSELAPDNMFCTNCGSKR